MMRIKSLILTIGLAIERYWRTIKYGEIYLKEYQSVQEAKDGITSYMNKYNSFRPHTAHGIKTPDEVYGATA